MAEEHRAGWKLVFTEEDDGLKAWQIREDIVSGFAREDFRTSVIIEWRYADEGPPDSDTREQLYAFGKHLELLDNLHGNSLLVHVIKGGGISEWCFYTKSYKKFMEELNIALSGKPRFPIEIFNDDDPSWKYWNGIRECVEEDDAN